MNAQELFHQDGRTAEIWYCEKCRIINREKELAEKCCNWTCSTCGSATKQYWTKCDACIDKAELAKNLARFESAEKLTEWTGWIYTDAVVGYQDGYFDSVESLREYCEDKEIPPPLFAWACTENHFVCATIDYITSQIADNAYEDFDSDDLRGLEELKKSIDVFNEANHSHISYEPDYKRAVLIAALEPKDAL